MPELRRTRDARSLVGTTLNDAYRVVRLIGEGAMGGIYEARQLRLDKRVAIKVMTRELAVNGEALLRFHREAEITSQLGHPNIITVFDFGTTHAGQPYLVMEYLEGEDLATRLHRKTALTLPAAVRITKQVASALAETHAKGVVHRDLKPANLFLVRVQGEDFAKVLDFGISKVRAASTALTNASTLMGTPMYMAPEQAKGETELDHLIDQWALSCITYEMLAGRPPYLGDDTAALLYQVVHQEPPRLSNFVNDLPPDVERVIQRALSKEPSERFPNVTAFARALEAAATGRPLPVGEARELGLSLPGVSLTPVESAPTMAGNLRQLAPPRPRRRSRAGVWAGVAIAAIAIAGGAMLVRGPLRRRPPAAVPAAVNSAPAVVEPLPPTPPPDKAADDQARRADNEPTADEDATDSTPAKIDEKAVRTTRKEGARRHPARRAKAAKHAAAPAPENTPAPTLPVKRKLINEL
ncbi:MAG TPA: serine/threonine-protein kinase [Polyangia bacterium]|nr:serine/threonine-protein kinase [Polyangia bacterium]